MRSLITLALLAALMLLPAPAGAAPADDLAVTSSLCCLTADGGPLSQEIGAYNGGAAASEPVTVAVPAPPEGFAVIGATATAGVWDGASGWVLPALEPGESATLTLELAPVQVLGVTEESSAAVAPRTEAAPAPSHQPRTVSCRTITAGSLVLCGVLAIS